MAVTMHLSYSGIMTAMNPPGKLVGHVYPTAGEDQEKRKGGGGGGAELHLDWDKSYLVPMKYCLTRKKPPHAP